MNLLLLFSNSSISRKKSSFWLDLRDTTPIIRYFPIFILLSEKVPGAEIIIIAKGKPKIKKKKCARRQNNNQISIQGQKT